MSLANYSLNVAYFHSENILSKLKWSPAGSAWLAWISYNFWKPSTSTLVILYQMLSVESIATIALISFEHSIILDVISALA